ncbi:transcriptional regulator, TetR family [Cohnella sp. OV330]|uniref:TetR/AcrR family transcriptional regulator n=1 Tax=Cohnella sp. OV330 TaxID=1855288 RepID=UPI0008E8B755|nr:TetR/AcrR family transcriptional regulator [Cohnella sp. OV330]SFB62159.1 transcriptional regulator, TetR family [Cohnella sp. OV330]
MIKPRKRSDAAENCRLILQTAKKLFAEQGVQTVSMHQIAKTAGVGQGTLYRCYAHKGELCAAIAEQVGMDTVKQLEDFLAKNQHLPACERIGGVLQYIIQFIDDKFQLLLPIHTVHDCEDESVFFRSPMYRHLLNLIAGLYEEAERARRAGQAAAVSPAAAETDDGLRARCAAQAHILLCSLQPAGVIHMRESLGLGVQEIVDRYQGLFAR